MKNRFVLNAPNDEIETFFSLNEPINFEIEPSFNISVGDLHPLIMEKDGRRQMVKAKWGLIPPKAESEREGKENATYPIEEAESNEQLREGLQSRRALIPASGFYKWKATENKSTPFYVRMLSDHLMALGGICNLWKSTRGRELYSFAILTDKASALIEPISERKPLIVKPEDFDGWLDKKTAPEEMLEKIEDYPSTLTEMIVNRVDEAVNDISNNDPSLIQPIPK